LATSVGLIVGLLAAGGYVGYLAIENHDRADRWRERSTAAQDLVADRTRALNRQTRLPQHRLDAAPPGTRCARPIRTGRRAAGGSPARARRREAQVEDERALVETQRDALAGVAGDLLSCRNGRVDSCRMHLAIAAIGAGTPAVCMEYQDKVGGLYDHFGLSGLTFTVEDLRSPGRVAERVLAALAASGLRYRIRAALPRVIRLAGANFVARNGDSPGRWHPRM
jgi:hypothetical protein